MTTRAPIEVRDPQTAGEKATLVNRLRSIWGDVVARKGEVLDPVEFSLLGAFQDDELVGLASYRIERLECEVVVIEAIVPRRGVGSVLMDAIRDRARAASCRRLWLITTNDNTPALTFYQGWGMDVVALHLDAMNEARRLLKPSIPERGYAGIPIKHELELELLL